MKRRDLLRWAGTASVLTVAGCVAGTDDETAGDGTDGSDADATPASDSTATPEPTSSGEEDDATGTESGEGDTRSDGDDVLEGYDDSEPAAAVESYLAAWRDGDIEVANALLSEDGEIEPVPDEEKDDVLPENVPDLDEITSAEKDGETASVEAVLVVSDQEERFTFDLRAVDGAWRIVDFGLTARKFAPTAEFDVDVDDGTATVRHVAGDAVPADELFVRGEGFDPTGVWHELSDETGSDEDVQAGHAVTVDVEDEYSLNVVWDDGEHSATVASMSGASESESVEASPVDSYLAETDNYDAVEDFTGQEEVRVEVGAGEEGFAFGPAAIRVDQGTTVVWEWTGEGGAHDVVHEDGEFESDVRDAEGSTFSYTFEESGTYRYFCTPHKALGMKGAVVVE